MSNVSIEYSQEDSYSSYEGVLFEQSFAENYLRTQVSAKYFDKSGTAILVEEFSDIVDTGFGIEELRNIFQINPNPSSWKIGECIAACFLEDFRRARFHYNSGRDAKNQEGSLPGADLVGFAELNDETVFLFGEVKTSDSIKSPPHVLHGRFGMICQLENIKNCNKIRSELIRWLSFKVKDQDSTDAFRNDFENALKNYLESEKKKQKLVGVLIRETKPNQNDLKSRYETFSKELEPEMFLTLSALYLPIKINDFEKFLVNGGNTNGI